MLHFFLLKLINFPVAMRTRFYPWFNRYKFKWMGAQCGRNFRVFNSVSVVNNGEINIGDDFFMTSGDAINPISSNLKSSIYTESGAKISIGNHVGMSSPRMWVAKHLTIGDRVKVGACCLFMDTDTHPIDFEVRRVSNQTVRTAPITIEDDVWIGAQCIILKGVTIGARSVIGAGSVVTKSIPADCIAAGNPCRVIRELRK